jgi:hypothetical protein
MKTIEINWIYFTPKKFNTLSNWIIKLEDLYKNPSSTKRYVFEFWKKELFDIYWLTGNFQQFTIYWRIQDNKDWKIYDVKITKDYNYVLN